MQLHPAVLLQILLQFYWFTFSTGDRTPGRDGHYHFRCRAAKWHTLVVLKTIGILRIMKITETINMFILQKYGKIHIYLKGTFMKSETTEISLRFRKYTYPLKLFNGDPRSMLLSLSSLSPSLPSPNNSFDFKMFSLICEY